MALIEWTEEPSSSEWGIMIFSMVNFVVNVASMGYLVYWRDYPPIRAKQVGLLIWSAAAGWMWYFGSLSATRVIPQKGAMLACNFWLFWVQIAFGALMWISCIILRMYRLYSILIEKGFKVNMMKHPNRWVASRLFIIVFPVIVIVIIFTALDADGSVQTQISTGEYKDLCSLQNWALYVCVLISITYFGIAVYLAFALRKIRKFLNEYRESKIALVCIVSGFIVYVVINVMSIHYKPWGRVLCVGVILFMINFSYWTLVGSVIYGRLFRPDETLEAFNASKDYDPNSTSRSSTRKSRHSTTTPGTSRNSLAIKSGVNSAYPSHVSQGSAEEHSQVENEAPDVEKQAA